MRFGNCLHPQDIRERSYLNHHFRLQIRVQHPLIYRQRAHKEKKIGNTEIGSQAKSESNLKTVSTQLSITPRACRQTELNQFSGLAPVCRQTEMLLSINWASVSTAIQLLWTDWQTCSLCLACPCIRCRPPPSICRRRSSAFISSIAAISNGLKKLY